MRAGQRWAVLIVVLACICGAAAAAPPRPPADASWTAKASSHRHAGSLTVVNEKGEATTLSAADLAKLPRHTAKLKDQRGNPATYEGVLLAEVLRPAHVTLGKDLRGPLLANSLLVEAADGYRAVFALPEVDPAMTDKVVLLADRKDGKALDTHEGPYRLVVPDEKRPSRWARQVVGIRVVRSAPAAAPTRESAAGRGVKDPQSAYEPRSGPGSGQKFLAQFAGDWDVLKTFYPRTGEPVHTEGECHQEMIHGGRFLQSDFVFGRGRDRTTGLGLVGFNPPSGTFTTVWTDSRSTRMSLRQSTDRFDGKEIVLHSASLRAGRDQGRRSRTITRLEDGGRKIVHRQYTTDVQGKARLIMELVLTRRDKPAR